MTSCVAVQCTVQSPEALKIEMLVDELRKTQEILGSTEEIKQLLMKKVRENDKEKIASEKDSYSQISTLRDEKKEMFSLLREQKEIIEELMLRECHKIKKLRNRNSQLVNVNKEMEEQVKNLLKEKETFKCKLLDEEKQRWEFVKEVEGLREDATIKDKTEKVKEEKFAVLQEQNLGYVLELQNCKEIIAASESNKAVLERYLQKEQDKLEQSHFNSIVVKEQHEMELNYVRNENAVLEEKCLEIDTEKKSLLKIIEELEYEIENYKMAVELKEFELNESEIIRETQEEEFIKVAKSNSELQEVNSDIKKEFRQKKGKVTKFQSELEIIDRIRQEKEKINENIIEKFKRLEKRVEVLMEAVAAIQVKKQRNFSIFSWIRKKRQRN